MAKAFLSWRMLRKRTIGLLLAIQLIHHFRKLTTSARCCSPTPPQPNLVDLSQIM